MEKMMTEGLSYKQSGVDIAAADATKKQMARALETSNKRVLNKIGAFASLFDGKFPEYTHPILVLKTEEPGSKQKLAFKHKRVGSICYDMINHLINDIAVMGAKPLAVQDAIICGKLEQDIVTELVTNMSEACKDQGCVLIGGETSEQPGVIEKGLYILSASMLGVVEKEKIIDGSAIKEGDVVLALPSNGLHTNGYSLVRALIDKDPSVQKIPVEGETFLDVILRPHSCYFTCLKAIFDMEELHGLAHITGGGIEGNLNRILGKSISAEIDLSTIKVPEIFSIIQHRGKIDTNDMLRTFNVGVGLTAVIDPSATEEIRGLLLRHGYESYPIGTIIHGDGNVILKGVLRC